MEMGVMERHDKDRERHENEDGDEHDEDDYMDGKNNNDGGNDNDGSNHNTEHGGNDDKHDNHTKEHYRLVNSGKEPKYARNNYSGNCQNYDEHGDADNVANDVGDDGHHDNGCLDNNDNGDHDNHGSDDKSYYHGSSVHIENKDPIEGWR